MFLLIMLVPVLSTMYSVLSFNCCFMLEHLCVDLEQESKEALATWVLVQIYTQSSFFFSFFFCLYVLAYFSL